MSSVAQQEEIIQLTENAAREIKDMLSKEENNAGKALRVFIEKGGCSGLQYGMVFDEPREGDFSAQYHGVPVLVDHRRLPVDPAERESFLDPRLVPVDHVPAAAAPRDEPDTGVGVVVVHHEPVAPLRGVVGLDGRSVVVALQGSRGHRAATS